MCVSLALVTSNFNRRSRTRNNRPFDSMLCDLNTYRYDGWFSLRDYTFQSPYYDSTIQLLNECDCYVCVCVIYSCICDVILLGLGSSLFSFVSLLFIFFFISLRFTFHTIVGNLPHTLFSCSTRITIALAVMKKTK